MTTENQVAAGLVGSGALFGWIDRQTKLPPIDTPVLIVLDGNVRMGELRRETPSWEDTWPAYEYWDDPTNDGMDWDWESITHWMPIPPLPNK